MRPSDIKVIRTCLHLSQSQLAHKLRVSRGAVEHWECGHCPLPEEGSVVMKELRRLVEQCRQDPQYRKLLEGLLEGLLESLPSKF